MSPELGYRSRVDQASHCALAPGSLFFDRVFTPSKEIKRKYDETNTEDRGILDLPISENLCR